MFSRFFIDRPIFAAVLSILITLAGELARETLPIAQFPRITPPTVNVTCNYPGASAKDVAESVAAPLEKEVNGVEGMMYMSSSSTNDGTYNLTVTFHQSVDANLAQVLVQNRVGLALNKLPDVIKATGVTTRKRSPDILMGIAITSPGGRYDQLYLSNFALRKVRDELSRVEGVGDVFLFGQRDYAMRVWVNPDQLASRNLTAADVVDAVRQENNEVAAGRLGEHTGPNQELTFPLATLGRLEDVEQFKNIVIRIDRNGRVTRVKDVARVDLGARNQDTSSRMDGKAAVFCAIFQLPDANALETADRVKAKMRELESEFPEDLTWDVGFETVPYTEESIKEVFKTLQEAIVLVAFVVLLFLQNWRAALIPLTAVPVAIVGTFAVMFLLGFSLNNLTLFGLVLAIGIVVDDAIVVVEAVEHHIETGLAPRDATIKAMDQVSGPVIAVGLVLSAVFVPAAFISGLTGLFFRQFALTIAVSTLISALNSLTLSPALCALLLRPVDKVGKSPLPVWSYPLVGAVIGYLFLSEYVGGRLGLTGWAAIGAAAGITAALFALAAWPTNFLLKYFFRVFNWGVRTGTATYAWLVGRLTGGRVPLASLLAIPLGAAAGWFVLGPLAARLAAATKLFAPIAPLVPVLVTVGAAFTGLMLSLPFVFGPTPWKTARPALCRTGEALSWAIPSAFFVLLVYGVLLGLTYLAFSMTPRGFIPQQDMGYMMVTVQLPDSAATERSDRVMRQMEEIALKTPGVKHATGIVGQSFALNATGPNFGSMFINLQPYSQRRSDDLKSNMIFAKLQAEFNKIPEAMIQVLTPPPVRGVGRSGGFAFVVEDRGDAGPNALQEQADNIIRKANEVPALFNPAFGRAVLFTPFRANVPQLNVRPNARECARKGVSIDDVNNTLRIYQGSMYVNDFNLFGRTWQVVVQADDQFRVAADQVPRLRVRNDKGGMVPLGSLVDIEERNGPLVLTRYNMYPAATINGSAAPGYSSGQGIEAMQGLAERELPRSMGYEWTDMSFLELQAGNTAMILFACGAVAVFLVLAAQYESWSLPLAVILVVPMCLLASIGGLRLMSRAVLNLPPEVNIFTQIGFVVLVGLASKNAILIVEFARAMRHAGKPRREAVIEACKLRLRPIVMTSFAFILGVVPMLTSEGAGAEMRKALGLAVFGGMIGATLFGLLLTPVFFYVVDWLGDTHPFRALNRAASRGGDVICRLRFALGGRDARETQAKILGS
jgi:multidrug efflux pump